MAIKSTLIFNDKNYKLLRWSLEIKLFKQATEATWKIITALKMFLMTPSSLNLLPIAPGNGLNQEELLEGWQIFILVVSCFRKALSFRLV